MKVAAGVALVLALAPVAASAMTVGEFLTKADALKAKGMAAMFSSDIGLLQNEIKTSSADFRAEQDAAVKAGRKPAACLPPKGQGKISSDEILASFRAQPAAASVRAAWGAMMVKRYPCR